MQTRGLDAAPVRGKHIMAETVLLQVVMGPVTISREMQGACIGAAKDGTSRCAPCSADMSISSARCKACPGAGSVKYTYRERLLYKAGLHTLQAALPTEQTRTAVQHLWLPPLSNRKPSTKTDCTDTQDVTSILYNGMHRLS